jgi:hypothetical protein
MTGSAQWAKTIVVFLNTLFSSASSFFVLRWQLATGNWDPIMPLAPCFSTDSFMHQD